MHSWHEGEDKVIITHFPELQYQCSHFGDGKNLWLNDMNPSQADLHLASGVDLSPKPPFFLLYMVQVVQPPKASLFLFVK